MLLEAHFAVMCNCWNQLMIAVLLEGDESMWKMYFRFFSRFPFVTLKFFQILRRELRCSFVKNI